MAVQEKETLPCQELKKWMKERSLRELRTDLHIRISTQVRATMLPFWWYIAGRYSHPCSRSWKVTFKVMAHNAIRVSIRNSCNIWLSYQPLWVFPGKEKSPYIEVLNLKKVMLHRVIYGYYCMEGRDEFTLMCKFSPKSIVYLNIKRISHFG